MARGNVLDLFQPAVAEWFRNAFDAPTPPQAAGLARHRPRRVDADPRADRQRQDADRVPLVHQPPDVRAAAGAAAALPRALHLAAQGAGGRHRAQPARAARRHRQSRRGPGRCLRRAGDCRPHRRHAGRRARPVPARPGRHPDHHAGVALPAAHVERARGAAQRSTRSSSTRSTRSCRPSAAPTSRCRSSGSSSCAARRRRCSASACPPRSGRSTKSRDFSAACRHATCRDYDRKTPVHPSPTTRPSPAFPEPRHDLPSSHHRRHHRAEETRPDDRSPGRGHGQDRRGRGHSRAGRRRRARCAPASGRRFTRGSSS